MRVSEKGSAVEMHQGVGVGVSVGGGHGRRRAGGMDSGQSAHPPYM